MVEQRLAEDEAKLAGKAGSAKPENAPGLGPQGPSPEDVAAAQNMNPADRQAMIESMVQGLADRLGQKGDDLAGWLKLVRAYTVLDRKDDALKALEKAKTQFSGNADALQQLDALAAELGLKS
jgi:cytochrome c-type biogenesis protein CcmH